jgi:hypothetical protein
VVVDVDHLPLVFGIPTPSRPLHLPLAVIGLVWFGYGVACACGLVKVRVLGRERS